MTKFNVVINPFSQKILVWARVNKIACDVVLDWDFDIYAWQTFEMGGKRFAIHITYEDELSVGVYDDNNYDIASPYPTTFKLTHKDEF
jgi:hypothetical protein